jgi:hypothetical protein
MAALVVLFAWQAANFRSPKALTREYRDRSAVGLCSREAARYFYYYYYYYAFPAVILGAPPPYTEEGAEAFLRARGGELRMAFADPCAVGHAGNYLKVLLFLPAALARDSPKDPTLRPVTVGLFFVALSGLLVASHRCGCFGLGLLLVALLGSNPFQLFETYARQNIYSLAISATLIALALNLKFLTKAVRPARSDWLLVGATGVLLTTVGEIRIEAATGLVSVVPAYLLARGISWKRRLAMLALLFGCIAATSLGWSRYFDALYDRAVDLVREHGGAVYTGYHTRNHPLWHSISTGLSDFGEDRGYFWDDRLAYARYTPLANAEFGLNLRYESGDYFENFYTEKRHYRIKPELHPAYTEIVRGRVIDDITGSPSWYAGILVRRLGRIFERTTPVQLHLDGFTLPLPFAAWVAIPLLIWLLVRREWFLAKLLAFTAPLSLVALFVYSGDGITYYAVFPSVAFAISTFLVVRAIRDVVAARRPAS